MKTKFLILILTVITFSSFSNKLTLEKASPFTDIKWENDIPTVKFKETWYKLEKIEHFTQKQLLDFCKENYGSKWQKRFSEDLVEVLNAMGYAPNVEVNLKLIQNGVSKKFVGEFTEENRTLIWRARRNRR